MKQICEGNKTLNPETLWSHAQNWLHFKNVNTQIMWKESYWKTFVTLMRVKLLQIVKLSFHKN